MVSTPAVGTLYGDASAGQFTLAASDPGLQRLAYVEVEHEGRRMLGQVQDLVRHGHHDFDAALAAEPEGPGSAPQRMSATISVLGYRDERGRVQIPRTPFVPGTTAHQAGDDLVQQVLGLSGRDDAAYIGHIKGGRLPVHLGMNVLAQKHLCVLAKTGAGKSYTVGVILEEFLKAKVPLVILDPHGEYGSLRSPNLSNADIDEMGRFGIKPKAFQSQVHELAIDTTVNPEAKRLLLEGLNLEGREIADLLPGKLPSSQIGLLYQAVKEAKESMPAYTLEDIRDHVQLTKSNAKWNVIASLDALIATGLFAPKGTPVDEIVRPGRCTIVNLRGVPPEQQGVVATRLTQLLWEERKRANIPPHVLVVEEAHNFCPERGVGSALSTGIIRTVASEGRKFGMGLTIISQRPAKIDKNVLSQCNTQIILKLTNPNDLKAVISSIEGITSDSADEIQRLAVGTALVSGGALSRPVYVEVRPRHSRHGGESVDVVGGSAARSTPPTAAAAAATAAPAARRPTTSKPSARRTPSPPASVTTTPTPHAAAPQPASNPATPPRPVVDDPVQFYAPVPRTPAITTPRPAPPAPATAPVEQPPGPTRQPRESAPPGTAAAAMGGRPPATGPPPKLSGKDRTAVHRVATRVGLVAGVDEASTIAYLHSAHNRSGKDANAYLANLAAIGRDVCHADAPACIRCPMAAQCHHHGALQDERRKARSPIRRLWRR